MHTIMYEGSTERAEQREPSELCFLWRRLGRRKRLKSPSHPFSSSSPPPCFFIEPSLLFHFPLLTLSSNTLTSNVALSVLCCYSIQDNRLVNRFYGQYVYGVGNLNISYRVLKSCHFVRTHMNSSQWKIKI